MADEKIQQPQGNDRFANRPEGEDVEGHLRMQRTEGEAEADDTEGRGYRA